MMPLKLTIRGMYSYREAQTIDFEKLTEGQIFGIFGSVGSGKSTILEAITFALYGETERMNARDGRNYNMMNLRSDELWVEFVFKSRGEGAKQYKFTFQGKRNRKRFEEVKTLDRRAYVWSEKEWEPLDSVDGEKVTGLSYENFRRTIIIPQGKFQEFLQLGSTERTRMLREIFDLGKFELAYKVGALEAANRTEMAKMEGELNQIPEVDADSLTHMAEEVAQAKEEAAKAGKRVVELQGRVAILAELRKKGQELAGLSQRWVEMTAQNDAMAQREKELGEFERCQSQFADKLSEKEQVSARMEIILGQKAQFQDQLDKLKGQLDIAKLEKESAKEAYLQRDGWKSAKEQLEKLAEILKWQDERKALQARVEKGKVEIEKQQAIVQQAIAGSTQSQADYELLKSSQPDLFRLAQAMKWYDGLALLQREGQDLAAAQKGSMQALAENDSERKAKLQQQGIELEGLTIRQVIQQKMDALDAELTEAGEAWRQAEVRRNLAEYSQNLAEGEPCPVCGSLHHPSPGHIDNGGITSREFNALKKEIDQKKLQWDQFQQYYREMELVETAIRNRLTELEAKVAANHAAIEAHMQAFSWPEYSPDDSSEVLKAQAEAQLFQVKVAEAEASAKQARMYREGAEQTLRTYETKVKALADEVQQLITREDTLAKQLVEGFAEAHAAKSTTELVAEAEELGRQWAAAGQRMQVAESAFERADQAFRQAERELASAESELKLLQERMAEIVVLLDLRLATEGFASLVEVQAILAKRWDVKGEKAALEDWRKALQAIELGKAKLEAELRGQQVSDEEWEAEEASLAAARIEDQEWNQRLGTLHLQWQTMQQHFAVRKELVAKYSALELRGQNLAELAKLFKASGFVTYISSIFLQELLARANDRFAKLTHHQLFLELGADNEFLVRDLLNGGATRSVKTLSGGQTFQAALCLALALSDSIQQQKGGGHHFFFMDEGFGSLDADSLRVVFETLTSLRKEYRIVGIISHVEALQQEIGTYLRIHQDEERGSLVQNSWD